MARYTGPVCKLARREGEDLEHKSGIKGFEFKCKSKVPPGTGHGGRPSAKPSDYQMHLRAKQKVRRYYGILERQFRNYYKKAAGGKTDTGETLLRLLETRLDNVVYRMGLAVTRAAARQLISHKHVLVDGKCINIPSYQLSPGQVISLAPKAQEHASVKDAIAQAEIRATEYGWLEVSLANLSGRFINPPEIQELIRKFDVRLVVEYYSK